MAREIAGPQWEPLPETEELAVCLAILDEDDAEPDESSTRFDLIRSAIPYENTHPSRSGYASDSRQPDSCLLPQDAGLPKDPPDIGDRLRTQQRNAPSSHSKRNLDVNCQIQHLNVWLDPKRGNDKGNVE
ncbi:hypothetical protein NX059_002407 [Plenodomus lindquistii]|nr:hypothetical protein NX059_002407 [Plenodomus lindquistii]